MATAVHGVMVAGLVSGFWDAGVCIVGIVLDSLAAYGLWLALYLRRRPRGTEDLRMLAKSFIGVSLGVWGFVAMFRSVTLRDTAFIATSFSFLKYVDLGDVLDIGFDEDTVLVLLVIVALILLLVSLYFLAQILLAMPAGDVTSIAAVVLALRIVEMFNYRRAEAADAEKLAEAERNLRELCLHVFVKGWFGAFLMLLIAFTALPMGWSYLAWSYAHDLLLRPWLWQKFGARLAGSRTALTTS